VLISATRSGFGIATFKGSRGMGGCGALVEAESLLKWTAPVQWASSWAIALATGAAITPAGPVSSGGHDRCGVAARAVGSSSVLALRRAVRGIPW